MAITKIEKVRRFWGKHPDANPTAVMEKFEASSATVYTARKTVKNPPRARKLETKSDLFEDIKIIQKIGVERVRKILDLLI